MNSFERDGVSFRYPENWTAEAEDVEEGGWVVTVSSPQTAFLVVSLRPDARDPADLADQTLDALKAEYQELDAENRLDTIAGRMAIGHDIDFLTVDVPVLCRVRCLETLAGSLLVMAQTAEHDRDENDPVLQAIVASLTVAEE